MAEVLTEVLRELLWGGGGGVCGGGSCQPGLYWETSVIILYDILLYIMLYIIICYILCVAVLLLNHTMAVNEPFLK